MSDHDRKTFSEIVPAAGGWAVSKTIGRLDRRSLFGPSELLGCA